MASLEPTFEPHHTDSAGIYVPAWVREPSAWLAIAAVGMLAVFVGLGVDAWTHNHGVGEESLLSVTNPGHLIAGIGLIVTTIAVLAGIGAALLGRADTVRDAMRGAVILTVACTAVVTIGVSSLVYIGATDATVGHSHGDEAVASAAAHNHDAAAASADGHQHDLGAHPTFTELQSMSTADLVARFPAGSVKTSEVQVLRSQVEQAHELARSVASVADAEAAGYEAISIDAEGMGRHFINYSYLSDGMFDPSKPEGLLFSQIDDGEQKLVGVWFLQLPGSGGATADVPPEGFAGDLDVWHGHSGICLLGSADAALGITSAECAAQNGNFFEDARWMMHVWVAPEVSENPDGFFAYINRDLASKQVAASPIKDGGF